MLAHVAKASNRGGRERLLFRRFGFGIPDLARALHSAGNALTLIVQDRLSPFANGKLCQMKVHELPWPKAELAALHDMRVRMRVTLSYFVEPNPARRGWRDRYRYASHGLRFEVKQATDSLADFKKKINKLALAEDEKKPDGDSDAREWELGPTVRHHGSLHADIWQGTAADLAARGAVGSTPSRAGGRTSQGAIGAPVVFATRWSYPSTRQRPTSISGRPSRSRWAFRSR